MKQETGSRIFFILYFIFLALGLFLNITCTQKEIFFWVNTHYTKFLDDFMELYTNAGDGIFCLVLAVLFILFVKIRHGLALAGTYALSGIVVQVLKRFIFTEHQRPWAAYVTTEPVHLVNNFTPFTNNSFPSGHEATAFCMATLFIFIWPKMSPWIQTLLFILALLVAYSRIYLSQHYFIDIYAGSIVGVLSSMLIYYYFYKRKYNSAGRFAWLDRPLLRINK